MAESYIENFVSTVDFPKPFQRTGKFPLDRTELFSSYEDAVKYAAGNRQDPDSRGLCGVSYVGQTITVYENGVVTDYKINADRTLSKAGSAVESLSAVLESGVLSMDITLPANSKIIQTTITDSISGEQLFTDISREGNLLTVSIAESYPNPLNIVVTYCN